MVDLNANEQATLKNLAARIGDDKPTILDPSDPAALAAIHLMLDIGNRSSARYPALHAGLARARTAGLGAAANAVADTPTIIDLGQDRHGRATSRTWLSMPGLPLHGGAQTVVLDESGAALASGTATRVGDGLLQVSTRTATARAASAKQTAITIYQVQPADGGPPRIGSISRTQPTQRLGLGDTPTVTDPVIKIGGHTQVIIGLNRQGAQPDCDYYYLENQPQNDPQLVVPFTGTAVVPYPITGIQPSGQIQGLNVASVVWVNLSSAPVQTSTINLSPAAVTGSGSTLTWGYPWNPNSTASSIIFNPVGQSYETLSAFYFEFDVPVNSPEGIYKFGICSKDTPDEPSITCYPIIADLKFTWHCLAAETAVTCDDGSRLPIRELHNRIRLRSGIGEGSLGVESTWYGAHKGDAVRLTTAMGQTLIATEGHPILTPRGLVAVRDLRAGDAVVVAGGTAALTGVEPVPYDGAMWNIELGNGGDRAAGYLADVTPGTFYANGIAVGDQRAQGRMYRASRRNFDYMAARIPQDHHRDYLSALEDLAK